MNKDKQIEEMAKHCCFPCEMECDGACIENINPSKCYGACETANALYLAGYRKADEVAREIFAEIEKIIDKYYNRHIFGVEDLSDVEQEAVMNFSDDITGELAELKKKYTEEGK